MRKIPCAVPSVGTFPQMDKKETFFLESCTLVCVLNFYLDDYHFNYPENLATKFFEKKDIDFCCVQINGNMSTLGLLITLCNMPKGLVT